MAAPVSFRERSDSFPLHRGRRPYMTHNGPRMCSAEWLGYPLTDHREFDILQSEPLAGDRMQFDQLKGRLRWRRWPISSRWLCSYCLV
jgi:hypothetical protein